MSFCIRCGHQMEAGAVFCGKCGSRAWQEAPPPSPVPLPPPAPPVAAQPPPPAASAPPVAGIPVSVAPVALPAPQVVMVAAPAPRPHPSYFLLTTTILLLLASIALGVFYGIAYNNNRSLLEKFNRSQDELVTLQAKSPPKPFPDAGALNAWVSENMGLIRTAAYSSSGWEAVVAVQNKAMSDGWAVVAYVNFYESLDYDYFLAAFVGTHDVYIISLGDDPGEVVPIPNLFL